MSASSALALARFTKQSWACGHFCPTQVYFELLTKLSSMDDAGTPRSVSRSPVSLLEANSCSFLNSSSFFSSLPEFLLFTAPPSPKLMVSWKPETFCSASRSSMRFRQR